MQQNDMPLTSTNDSSMGVLRWCNHLVNVSEAALVIALLLFWPLLLTI